MWSMFPRLLLFLLLLLLLLFFLFLILTGGDDYLVAAALKLPSTERRSVQTIGFISVIVFGFDCRFAMTCSEKSSRTRQ